MNENSIEKEVALEKIITSAIQLPLVKVNRENFLISFFEKENVDIQEIVNRGPVGANVSKEQLATMAKKLILVRTSESSAASFLAGLPGGLAMAATVPMDVLQFFGVALRLAQELSYIYGADDLWEHGKLDDEKVKNQLFLYCGVMFGVSGAVSGVRVLTAQVAKTALKKIPQKALTKTFWYPIIKQIGKVLSIKVTKSTVATGVAKAIPVVGGVISGSLNFASMMPMANRLQTVLESASFGYTENDFEKDLEEIENIAEKEPSEERNIKERIIDGGKKAVGGISGLFSKKKEMMPTEKEDVFETIKKLSELKNAGILSDEEFDVKKTELLSKI